LSNSVAFASLVSLSIFFAVNVPTTAASQKGQRLTAQQCRDAIIVSDAIKRKYAGRISAKLVASFAQFRDSSCDLGTSFTRVERTADDDAYGEFRVRLIALRSASF
jgi:hypothetical protein